MTVGMLMLLRVLFAEPVAEPAPVVVRPAWRVLEGDVVVPEWTPLKGDFVAVGG